MLKINYEDNTDATLAAFNAAKGRILEIIGQKIVGYAKRLCPVGTRESTGKKGYRGGTLRNSITHRVVGDVLEAGSNVEYAPYVELGTGPYYEAPPDWEGFDVPKSSGTGHGYVKPRPFLKPAVLEHIKEYEGVAEQELRSTRL